MQNLNFKNAVNLCGDQVEIAREMIQAMLNDLPAQKALLEEAYQQENWEGLEHLAHKLAGAAVYCGMEKLHYTAKQVCACLRQGEPLKAPQNYKQLQNAIREVSQVMIDTLHI